MLGLGSCKSSIHTAIHAATKCFFLLVYLYFVFCRGKTLLMEIMEQSDRKQGKTNEPAGIQKTESASRFMCFPVIGSPSLSVKGRWLAT